MKAIYLKRMTVLAMVGLAFCATAFANTTHNDIASNNDSIASMNNIANIDKAMPENGLGEFNKIENYTIEEPVLVYAEDAWTIHSGIAPEDVKPEDNVLNVALNDEK